MNNEIVFKLGETKLPDNTTVPCLSIVEKSTKVNFDENDHIVLLADPGNQAHVTVFFDDQASKDLFDAPPESVILLPKDVAGSDGAVDRFVLKIRADLDNQEKKYRFETEPRSRCDAGDLDDVIVEC